MVVLLMVLAGTASCSSSEPAAGNGPTGDGSQGAYRVIPAGQRHSAPALNGSALQGPAANLQRLRGNVVVINFWASWCGPCRAESPVLETVFTRTTSHGVAFAGVNEKDSRSAATTFMRDQRITYPSIFDPNGSVAAAWPAAAGLPYTFVLDRQGRIAARIIGGVTEQELRSTVLQVAAAVQN